MKILLLSLLLYSLSFAGTYDVSYTELDKKGMHFTESQDQFMDGEFLEIIRFNRLDFSDGNLDKESGKYFQDIVEKIKSYINNYDIRITVIGHSNETTDIQSEKKVDSNIYANKIQNLFRYSLSKEDALSKSNSYSSNIANLLVDKDVSEEIITVENRAGKDMGFSSGTTEGIELSNRVMVTMYVLSLKDADSDTVIDSKDRCPSTPKDVKVDEYGCPLDSDKDGVLDYTDECKDTPLDIEVDEKGCALDSDEDGVLDYLDKCSGTMKDLKVDESGCPLSITLKLNFETDSYTLEDISKEKVLDFANFLIDNPMYDVEITGHTDYEGSQEYNMELSYNRAKSLKDALMDFGIDENRLIIKWRGELEPIQSNETENGRFENRRTEVKLINERLD